jgi:hypothetical protein
MTASPQSRKSGPALTLIAKGSLVDKVGKTLYNRYIDRNKAILKCKNPRSNAKRVVTKGYEASLETRPTLNNLEQI